VNNDMAYKNRESTVSIEKLIEENISDPNIDEEKLLWKSVIVKLLDYMTIFMYSLQSIWEIIMRLCLIYLFPISTVLSLHI